MKSSIKKFLNKNKNIINIIVLVIITGIVLYLALKDDFEEIVHNLKTINILYLLIAFVMIFIYWLLRSLALHSISKKVKTDNKYSSSFQLM